MKVEWKEVHLPEFGVPAEIPGIHPEEYERRCEEVYRAVQCDWFVVYGDREHFANMHYLSGYDPCQYALFIRL